MPLFSTVRSKSGIAEKKIGVQVYSVRNELEKDFQGSLKKIADIGFSYIEAYGLGTDGKMYGMSPSEYRKTVEDLGMEVVSSHSTYFTPEDAPKVVEAAKEAGLTYLIVPYLAEPFRKDYDEVAANLNELGAMFKKEGIVFGYHNHAFEFEPTADDRIPMEILLEGTEPDNVTFQVDLYWVVNAGYDPIELIKKYPGRFTSFHVKDADKALQQTTVGTGIVDFKTILNEQEVSGWKHIFVEDERTGDPFANLSAAYNYLQSFEY